MKTDLNATVQDMPGTRRSFDGKMNYYFPLHPWPIDYANINAWHITRVHQMAMYSGFRHIVPNFEGKRTDQHPELREWLRYNLQTATRAVLKYEQIVQIFGRVTRQWCEHLRLPRDYILWGIFGFPYNARKVAKDERSLEDYLAQVELELPVTAHFTAFYPPVYVTDHDDLDLYEVQLRTLRRALDLANPDGKPVYPYFQRCFVDGLVPISQRDIRTMLDMINRILSPAGVTYWEGQSIWSREPTDKWQLASEFEYARENRG